MNKRSGRVKKKNGFTLLELLMVVIVIGILATLAIPQYASFAEKARASEAISTISAIKTAQSLYKLENSKYAATLDALTGTITIPVSKYWEKPEVSGNDAGFTVTLRRGGGDGRIMTMTYKDADGSEDWNASTHPGADGLKTNK